MRNFWLMVTVILFSINSNVFARDTKIIWTDIGFDVDKLNEFYEDSSDNYCRLFSNEEGLTEQQIYVISQTYVKLGCYPQEFADFTWEHRKFAICAGAGPEIIVVCGLD